MGDDEARPILTAAGEMIGRDKNYWLYREIELILRDAYHRILKERDKRKKEVHGSVFGEATEIALEIKRFMDWSIERQRQIERHYIEKARDTEREGEK